MFEIHVSDNDVTSGSIPVSWCVTPDILKSLSDLGVKDPQVVLVVAPDTDNHYGRQKETRQVVPLKDMMAYLDFKVAGVNKIWGFISQKGRKAARNCYLSKTNNQFDSWLLTEDGREWVQTHSMDAQPISIDVPKEAFAPEPAAWEKAWVNHFFNNKCVDQCNFRRRRLFAYSIQPLIALAYIFFRLVTLSVALLLGTRGVSLKPLLHPLSIDHDSSWNVFCGGSIFINHLPEDDELVWTPTNFWAAASYVVRSFWKLPFMPLFLIPILLLAYFGKLLLVGSITLAGLVTVALIVAAIFFFMDNGLGRIIVFFEKHFSSSDDGYWYLSQEEMDALVCNGEKKPLSLDELPSRKRTLRLYYRNLKSKVCRPFSG